MSNRILLIAVARDRSSTTAGTSVGSAAQRGDNRDEDVDGRPGGLQHHPGPEHLEGEAHQAGHERDDEHQPLPGLHVNGRLTLGENIADLAGLVIAHQAYHIALGGKTAPLRVTLGVCDNVAAFTPNGHKTQIKEFLDFAYQDKYQLAFDREYDLLPATTTATKALSSDPVFSPFLTALPNSVQYPSDSAWANLKTKIQQTIGTAVTGNPRTVLSQLQQTATSAG